MRETFAHVPLTRKSLLVLEAWAARRLCELALDAIEWEWRPALSRWIDPLVVLEERE